MKNRYVLMLVVCFVVAGSIGGGVENSVTEAQTVSPAQTPGPRFYTDANPMPEEILYFALFQMIEALKQKDTEFHARGETTAFRDTFYNARLRLMPEQFQVLESAYTDYATRVAPIDARAREIITKYRAAFPNGELKRTESKNPTRMHRGYEKPPPVPPDLVELQKQKDETARAARENIRQSLGEEAFTRFESSLREDVSRVLVPIKLANSVLPPISEVAPQKPAEGVKK